MTEPNIDYDREIDAINQDLQRVYDFVETVSTTLRDNSNNPSALKELDLYDSVQSLIRQTKSETLKNILIPYLCTIQSMSLSNL